MTLQREVPIKDRQFHEAGLRAIEDRLGTPEGDTLAAWHVTAIGYLDYGKFHDLGGPGMEVVSNGQVIPVAIEPWLVLVEESKPDRPAKYRPRGIK